MIHSLVERKYNDNIDLVYEGQRPLLVDNEWYALMVTSRKEYKDPRTFFDEAEGWLGLECTSEGRVYISKDTSHSSNRSRGQAFVVRVKNPGLCYDLTWPVKEVKKPAPRPKTKSRKRSAPQAGLHGLR